MLARVYSLLKPVPLKDAVLITCKNAAEAQAGFAQKKPWPFEYWHFGSWGNSGGILSRVFDAYWLEKVVPVTELRKRAFGEDYGVRIVDGPLAGIFSRAIVIVDGDGKVTYTEQVPEIAQEPDYDAALKALGA